MTNPRTRRRVAREMQVKLAQLLLQEFTDPRLQWVSVHEVLLTPDMRDAYVIVDVIGDEKIAREALVALQEARGRLRGFLSKAMKLRFIPQLHFIPESDTRAATLRLRYGR